MKRTLLVRRSLAVLPLLLLGACGDSAVTPTEELSDQFLAGRLWLQQSATGGHAGGWEVTLIPRSARLALEAEGAVTRQAVREEALAEAVANPAGFFRLDGIPGGYGVLGPPEDLDLGASDACVSNSGGDTFCYEELSTEPICIGLLGPDGETVEDEVCIGGASQDEDPWDVLTEDHVVELAEHEFVLLGEEQDRSSVAGALRLKDPATGARWVELQLLEGRTGRLLATQSVEVTGDGAPFAFSDLPPARYRLHPAEDRFFEWGRVEFPRANEGPPATADNPLYQDASVETVNPLYEG